MKSSTMQQINVKRDGEKWGAFVGEKRIVVTACRSCVVKALIGVTKGSTRYDKIVIHNDDESTEVIEIGAASER